ncbi:hypothetical protein PSTG_05458 [Puccinia striiformis f. sp. tritici PST-78]|uniref:Uncharacterized protein n=1 Tax=Puccinia striiformis f. sp. tritici PST-78 TaxID=1165861 RepID=A0A0L0VPZ6_9BASI|nr:hypothetical protein PSTG_05458 [Puccinia striiformis f. sp. tritici PST-78]
MVERTARRESSEIEVWAARTNDKGVHCSPARKLMRSPLDSSITHSVARLTFGGSRPASRPPSISPTRKRPGSDRSSNQLVGVTSSKSTRGTVHQPPIMAPPVLDKPPLNDLGLAMTLDEFIEHCNLGDRASVAHGLIKLNHISHWDFFYRDATAEQLQLLSFPYALARELLKGAERSDSSSPHVSSSGN